MNFSTYPPGPVGSSGVDFQFSEEQDALRAAVRALVGDWAARSDARDGLPDDVWRALVEPRMDGPAVPEPCGGLGLGLVDAVVVLEEMGRVAFPGPYLSSLVAADAARRLGLDDLAGAIARGEAGTVALEEPGAGNPVARRADARPAVGRRPGRSRARSRSSSTVPVRRGSWSSRGRPTASRRSGSTTPSSSRSRPWTRPAPSAGSCSHDTRPCPSGRRATTPRSGARLPTTPRSRWPRSSRACATRPSRWRWTTRSSACSSTGRSRRTR